MSRFLYLPFITIACILLLHCEGTSTNKEVKDVAQPNASVPIYDYEGLKHLLQKNNDTTYVINLWATWCKPCVKELPYFEEIHEVYKKEKLKVILVSLDFKNQIEKKLIPFIQKNNLKPTVVVLTDPDSNIDNIDTEWSGSIPATIVYRQDKRAFYEKSFESFEELNDIIKPFIK